MAIACGLVQSISFGFLTSCGFCGSFGITCVAIALSFLDALKFRPQLLYGPDLPAERAAGLILSVQKIGSYRRNLCCPEGARPPTQEWGCRAKTAGIEFLLTLGRAFE